jgi:cell division protein ZapE
MNTEFLEGFTKFKVPLSPSYIEAFAVVQNALTKLNSDGGFFSILKKEKLKGVYIHGLTGSGKTTLMDSFFEELKISKLNIHFHDYFIDISKLLTRYSVVDLAKKLANRVKALCFDEFFIESIADAKLLYELFNELIKNGVFIFLTSNFHPEKLYEGGFNREVIFPKFSNFILENFDVIFLANNFDFRQNINSEGKMMIHSIPDDFNTEVLQFDGHKIECKTKGAEVILNFDELFKKPRSTAEFIFISRNFDVIYVSNFKQFTNANEDEAIRFRNFIDVVYIRHNVLHIQGNFNEKEIFSGNLLENIKIKRTYSRICEMSSAGFISNKKLLKRRWGVEAKSILQTL